MIRRKGFWVGGAAAAIGAGVLVAAPLVTSAQGDDDWVTETLGGLVEDGTLTQAQADAVDQALDSARPDFEPRRGPGFGRGGHRIGFPLDEAAEAIGIERAELVDALRDGQTIAEVAAEHDVAVQDVVDAMVAAARERIETAVADGRVDEAVGAARIAELQERITAFVEDGPPAHDGRGPDHRDKRDADDDTSPDSTPGTAAPTTTEG